VVGLGARGRGGRCAGGAGCTSVLCDLFDAGGLFGSAGLVGVRSDGGAVQLGDLGRGALVWSVEVPGSVSAVDVWDGWVAVGTQDGSLRVFDTTGTLRALVRHAHQRRVSKLIFREGHLFSASYDGTIRRWSLAHIGTPAAELAARWPLSLDDALDE